MDGPLGFGRRSANYQMLTPNRDDLLTADDYAQPDFPRTAR